MESSGLSPFLQQLPYHLPILIVSLVGLSLSVIFWSRCPGPTLLTLIATALLLVPTVVVIWLEMTRLIRKSVEYRVKEIEEEKSLAANPA